MKILSRVSLLMFAVALLVTAVPVGASATDADVRIESSAQDSYVFQKYLKDDAISIESSDGIVTLTGTVVQVDHKALAQETVAGWPGVISVVNRLKVAGEPVAENSDGWIGMKVKTSLLFHRNVSAMTEVTAKDGIVTLQGEATSQAQKDLTTEMVKDVAGVQGVKNEMTVAKTPDQPVAETMGKKIDAVGDSVDDASTTALVKMTLLYHRSTSGLRTTVETNKGVVMLSGTAKNAAEKDLVSKYVQDVHGVKSVVNNITVEKPKPKRKIEGC
ncbi:MAG: BON domain-containing protein [Desulfobulbaceae bacterium]|jgi:hyperosmotically inducible protein|nr:BON domain-containing protein [Desulfobulbaceae bacterium]